MNSTKNPQQIAILHWYKANRTAQFNVATGPAAFDGAHIWVINSNNVTKLRASDGASLGTFAVGDCPVGIAFDGANIWVGNSLGVTKLRASDGANLGTFAAAGGGVVFDGANIWVGGALAFDGANIWALGSVTKVRASDGAILGTFVGGGGSNTLSKL